MIEDRMFEIAVALGVPSRSQKHISCEYMANGSAWKGEA